MLIGEVSRRTGISARMLRHYDSVGLVSPTGRTEGGYRQYSPADIRRLFHVESLRSLGLSLRDLRRALDEPGFTPSGLVGELVARTQERIARDEELLRRLQHVEDGEPTEWTDVLRIVSLMRGLDSADASRRQQSALAAAGDEVPPGRLLAEAVLEEADPNVAGALRWALQRSNDEALRVLAAALGSADAETRRRAVAAIAEIGSDAADTVLTDALTNTDPAVRESAALALGARGGARVVPVLVGMVVAGRNDVEAAETLGAVAQRWDLVDQVAGTLAELLARPDTAFDVRLRLVQSLAEIPGPAAGRTLQALTEDPDHRLAQTAAFIARTRATARGRDGDGA
ncbi:HEAT repeat domain-containing protein [Geodermatophilus sp. CPCC 206100]|uniref:HEAT repeat domain-containing protein n=1 Tax=Geodermatophilus sp. CPCC 206100 TaxID=3020054 RepID=UPI003B00BD76